MMDQAAVEESKTTARVRAHSVAQMVSLLGLIFLVTFGHVCHAFPLATALGAPYGN